MNNLPTNPETPDELDRLLADFFKAQLKKPWPNAPVPPAASAQAKSEPSELAIARTTSAPQQAPAPVRRDNTARARFTLAASVAVLLGTGLLLSNNFEPSSRQGNVPVQNGKSLVPDSSADGKDDLRLKKIEQDKLKDAGNGGRPKVGLD